MSIENITPAFGGVLRNFHANGSLDGVTLGQLRAAMDDRAVLVIKGQQHLQDEDLAGFSALLGRMHTSITADRSDMDRRLTDKVLSDISNIDRDGAILPSDNARRLQQRANLIWHTDNSFRRPAGLYTLLAARIVPPVDGETEFADTRAAFDALPDATRQRLRGLQVEHSLAHSRFLVGTETLFEAEEATRFPAVVQPLVRRQESSGREALYIGSHARQIVGWSYEDSQELLTELLEFATRPSFVYRHAWSVGDLVMWDNRVTLHRALPFDDVQHRRDLRRTSIMLEEEVA